MSSGIDGGNGASRLKTALKSNESARKKRDGHDLEDAFQIEAAKLFSALLPDDSWWCHVPNGGKRPLKTAIRLKKMGTRAGAPDNLIVYRGKAHWIELKARYGSLQQSQIDTIPLLESAGSPVAVARTLEDIVASLEAWGIPLKASLESYRAQTTQPQRMSASAYRAVMGLDADATEKDTRS